jgi:hypothetical protein
MIKPCECGNNCSVWSSLCSSRGHGYAVNCSNCHPGCGPWAKTKKGAIRLWNAERRKP